MSFNYRTRSYGSAPGDTNTAGTYAYERFQLLLWTEEGGNPHLLPYLDSQDLATNGIGFLLVGRGQEGVRDKVFTAMGITSTSARSALHPYFNAPATRRSGSS